MKRLLILCVLLLCIVPFASAASWKTISPNMGSNGNNWTANASGDAPNAWKAGDGDYGTRWNHYMQTDGAWITWLNPTGIYYSKIRVRSAPWSGDATVWTCNNVVVTSIPNDWINVTTSGGGAVTCSNVTSPNMAGIWEIEYENGTAPAPIANFTAAPLNATAPAYVAFTDTSENEYGTCTYNWTYTPSTGVLVAPQDLDNEDITMLFTENGDFTISHGVSCAAGSNISTKTDYIHITNATALSTFRVRAVDMLSGYGINGAQVNVFDIESTNWTNQTSATGEVTVSAVTGHNINAYGTATGYDDGESLGLPVVAGSLYPIYMRPTDMPGNVSAGNVTAYITVLEDGTNNRLSGYGVSVTGPSTGGADFTSGVTDDNGIYQVVLKNQTNYNVKVIAQKGHLGANKNFNSGTQSGGDSYVEVTLWLGVNSITTAPTVTTLPGGGTPAPTVTYLANCDPSAPDYDAAKCRTSKGGMGLNILADNLENLIWLVLIVTMIYLLKGIGK
jgi:hypothetical protein